MLRPFGIVRNAGGSGSFRDLLHVLDRDEEHHGHSREADESAAVAGHFGGDITDGIGERVGLGHGEHGHRGSQDDTGRAVRIADFREHENSNQTPERAGTHSPERQILFMQRRG